MYYFLSQIVFLCCRLLLLLTVLLAVCDVACWHRVCGTLNLTHLNLCEIVIHQLYVQFYLNRHVMLPQLHDAKQ